MDFDAEFGQYMAQPQIKSALNNFIVSQVQSGTGGVAQYKSEALNYAKMARDAIVAALPSEIANGVHRIMPSDLLLSEVRVDQNGDFVIMLSWNPNAIHRDSLYSKGYPAGLDDIVALYSTGFVARNRVYGAGKNQKRVMSRVIRPPDYFIKRVIQQFNLAHQHEKVRIEVVDPARYRTN